jgi:hypothetical protein
MGRTQRLILVGIVVWLLPQTIAAQAAPAYRAPVDTQYIEVSNPYHLYLIRGSDTVGNPIFEFSVVTQAWRATRGGFRIARRQTSLDVRRGVKIDTYDVAADGRVLRFNDTAASPRAANPTSILLPLPSVPLARDVAWSDSESTPSFGAGGAHLYDISRHYRVTRMFDTLSRHVAEVASEGTVHYRYGWWADSASGTYAWIDVRGPVHESFLFDPIHGQLVARRWVMQLRGTGGGPTTSGRVDTVPAGLDASQSERWVTAERARLLLRPLPGRDSAISRSAHGSILLHTVERGANTIHVGFARNDGMVGTMQAQFDGRALVSYDAVWTDTSPTATTQRIERRGDHLFVRAHGRDSLVAIPPGTWAVADIGVSEFLVPALESLPRDGAPHELAVFRPYLGRWEAGTATARSLTGGFVVMLQLGEKADQETLLITSDGDYVFGETAGPQPSQRVPPVGSSRRRQLEGWLKQLGVAAK